MTDIANFDYRSYLSSLVDFESSRNADYSHDKPSLLLFKRFLGHIGNPQLSYPTIIIAGSKGKGSTGFYLAELLRTAGYKAGLYASPHIENMTERINVGGIDISDSDFSRILQILSIESESANYKLSCFEALTACAFYLYEERKVDVAILEVGLGGRLDATNTAHPRICIVTKILLEHESVLGNSLIEIAGEKAEVITESSFVISPNQHPQVVAVLESKCCKMMSTLEIVSPDNLCGIDGAMDVPPVLQENLALAARAYFEFTSKEVSPSFVIPTMQGRYQTIATNKSIIVADAAHNPASIAPLLIFASEKLGSFRVIFAVLDDKKFEVMLKQIPEHKDVTDIVFIRLNDPRAVKPEVLRDSWNKHTGKLCRVAEIEEFAEILEDSTPLLVTGSFRIMRHLYSHLKDSHIKGRNEL